MWKARPWEFGRVPPGRAVGLQHALGPDHTEGDYALRKSRRQSKATTTNAVRLPMISKTRVSKGNQPVRGPNLTKAKATIKQVRPTQSILSFQKSGKRPAV